MRSNKPFLIREVKGGVEMEIYTEFVTAVLNGLITIVITTLTMMLYHFRKINKLINDMFDELREIHINLESLK